MKKFSLVMATYGREKEVDNFLNSILSSEYDLNLIEIIIVDQNEKINLTEIVGKYDGLKIKHIKSKVKGLSQNRNIGLNLCTGEIVAFPDDDCEYLPGTLKCVNKIFNSNDQIDVVMGRIVERDDSDSLRKWPREIININGGNFYTKCSSITMFHRYENELKFNEKLGSGNYYGSCEDSDILYKQLKANKNVIYQPEVKVYHPHYSSSSNMDKNKVFSYGLGFGAFCKYNFDINIMMLFLKAEGFHVYNTLMGIITLDGERIHKGFLAFYSRIKGFITS